MDHYMIEYKNAMDNLQLSEEQQDRLFRAAVHQADQNAHRRRPVHRTAIAGIVLAFILALTACGVAIKTISEMFAPYLGSSESQSAFIEKYGTALEASDTDNGVTISAKAVLGDKYHAWILYTISWDNSAKIDLPDNIPQTPSDYSTETDLSYLCFDEEQPPSISIASGYTRDILFTDSDPSDNEIELLELYSFDGTIPFRYVSMNLDTLYWYSSEYYSGQLPSYDYFNWYNDDASAIHTAIEGHWELSFDASYEDCSITIPLENNTFTYNGYTCEITDLTISPLSAFVEYTYARTDDDPEITEDEWGTHDAVRDSIGSISSSFYITTTSGETYHTNSSAACAAQYFAQSDSYRFRECGSFSEIIPLDEMESITIGDATFEIPHD